jgi:hypothetical protein
MPESLTALSAGLLFPASARQDLPLLGPLSQSPKSGRRFACNRLDDSGAMLRFRCICTQCKQHLASQSVDWCESSSTDLVAKSLDAVDGSDVHSHDNFQGRRVLRHRPAVQCIDEKVQEGTLFLGEALRVHERNGATSCTWQPRPFWTAVSPPPLSVTMARGSRHYRRGTCWSHQTGERGTVYLRTLLQRYRVQCTGPVLAQTGQFGSVQYLQLNSGGTLASMTSETC